MKVYEINFFLICAYLFSTIVCRHSSSHDSFSSSDSSSYKKEKRRLRHKKHRRDLYPISGSFAVRTTQRNILKEGLCEEESFKKPNVPHWHLNSQAKSLYESIKKDIKCLMKKIEGTEDCLHDVSKEQLITRLWDSYTLMYYIINPCLFKRYQELYDAKLYIEIFFFLKEHYETKAEVGFDYISYFNEMITADYTKLMIHANMSQSTHGQSESFVKNFINNVFEFNTSSETTNLYERMSGKGYGVMIFNNREESISVIDNEFMRFSRKNLLALNSNFVISEEVLYPQMLIAKPPSYDIALFVYLIRSINSIYGNKRFSPYKAVLTRILEIMLNNRQNTNEEYIKAVKLVLYKLSFDIMMGDVSKVCIEKYFHLLHSYSKGKSSYVDHLKIDTSITFVFQYMLCE